MFGLSRGRPAGGALSDAHATGAAGGSGMVPAGAPITTNPDAGGRVDDLGLHVVRTNPQPATDLEPIPGVETRPALGGLRTAHHAALLRDTPMFDGSHVELVGRRFVAVIPGETILADAPDVLPSLRTPPPSDPYGRACVNASAQRAAENLAAAVGS